MNTTLFNILWFSCQGTSRDIVNQRSFWFLWLIFVQYGLYGILLTVYSALSRLTDHGIFYITRCRIWLLTILYHISTFNEKWERLHHQNDTFLFLFSIYPTELHLNKANTSDKETSFLDLNIKVIGSDIHTSVYDKLDMTLNKNKTNHQISSNSHPSVTAKWTIFSLKIGGGVKTNRNIIRMKSYEFLIVNLPWLSDDVPRLPSYGMYYFTVS